MNNKQDTIAEISCQRFFMLFTTFLSFVFYITPSSAENVITSGATIRINSGAFVTVLQNVVIENDGKLTNEGKLILKNNFNNQNPDSELGAGTIEFSGTTAQSISGQNTIGSLVVNNLAGLDLNGNTKINTELALQNGHIRLGTNNLTLGTMALVPGTPSASAMVIASGTGELRKSFSTTGSFTYPVGDDTGITEYSPVTIDVSNGTFAMGNYVGVKLFNSAYPGLSGNYLDRYWSIAQSGITGSNVNAVFQYLLADINGNENDIRCLRVNPAPIIPYSFSNTTLHKLIANGLTTLGVFSGAKYGAIFAISDTTINTIEPTCFNALDTIIVAGDGLMVEFLSGSSVDLIAGTTIRFLPGFHAFNGSQMKAWITSDGTFCDGSPAPIVALPETRSKDQHSETKPEILEGTEKFVKVYPNPNNGQFTLELTNVESGAIIYIYNLLGAAIYQSTTMNQTSCKINLPRIKRGIYFVKVTDQKDQFTRKMIVN